MHTDRKMGIDRLEHKNSTTAEIVHATAIFQ